MAIKIQWALGFETLSITRKSIYISNLFTSIIRHNYVYTPPTHFHAMTFWIMSSLYSSASAYYARCGLNRSALITCCLSFKPYITAFVIWKQKKKLFLFINIKWLEDQKTHNLNAYKYIVDKLLSIYFSMK